MTPSIRCGPAHLLVNRFPPMPAGTPKVAEPLGIAHKQIHGDADVSDQHELIAPSPSVIRVSERRLLSAADEATAQVEKSIVAVEAEIKVIEQELQLFAHDFNSPRASYLRDKELRLRDKELRLRDEKKELLNEKKDLRNEKTADIITKGS
jgi:hypothetical protein